MIAPWWPDAYFNLGLLLETDKQYDEAINALKLYLASYRNIGAFHEDATVGIAKRIVVLIEPAWLRIGGYWYPRGGIPIDVFWQSGTAPDGLWVPDQGVSGYRGRG